ncbi:bifunctional 2-C-methyl-D-erythritol 4-phosphate cytidylyltransferase/2-C-methyl-D-erythritol 2,4-cyclodiphosphate synthase [Alkalicaulis satelles]|uniref:Bifunctional enzyme IspD/IspF n=1 Tax=Alkalicaulis satelles TaxID=2609175 RepID=A0A5M6ZJ24_9PROT|nr:bifunctional 2-C-methyl-D-erythritol 4-phosphate cytidylyltransferase/2-C-methyl-D-erythritol 2,4-cyclodiphosphate synthase [Alkalicaulis satelles]KAA5804789.1 bifunctional 2-C-methyl-D-erythritol 4-phosphate cytidylyltransferase/2-C-methyl-D-erythritol 2,4-cyclodiphosphate synthase [Alkalicaulis satelles]
MDRRFAACIMAAGRGARAGGGMPKQFRPLAGRPVIAWSVEAFARHSECCDIIIVHAPGAAAEALEALGELADRCTLVEGGETRHDSVRCGVAAARAPLVLIHDAARPFLSQALIDRLLEALEGHEGAIPALPLADSVARMTGTGPVPEDRAPLRRLQTPQGFRTDRLRAAFASHGDPRHTDETALAHAAGLDITLIEGEEMAFKLTFPEDFVRAEQMAGAASVTVTGSGYDVHRLAPGDGVTLCGVFIACDLALVGHSDADAGLHALTDAILGAAGLGDIGDHFPPSDNRWKGADSAMFLTHALELAAREGLAPVHCDVTLICERPKIGPHKAAMKARLAALTGLPENRVNVKATTTEKLGFTGRGEGLAAEAVMTMRTRS